MGNLLWVGIGLIPIKVTKPKRSTQTCIPSGLLNWVPALIGWGNGGNVTSAEWQVTLCDSVRHVSSRSSKADTTLSTIQRVWLVTAIHRVHTLFIQRVWCMVLEIFCTTSRLML